MSAVLDLDALEAQSFRMLLEHMRKVALAKAWFDITCFNPLSKIFDDKAEQAARAGREFKLLARLHCVHFDSMDAKVREAIPALVEAVIEAARVNYGLRAAGAAGAA